MQRRHPDERKWTNRRHVSQAIMLTCFLLFPMPLPIPGLEQGIIKFDLIDWRIYFFGLTLVPGLFHIFYLSFLLPFVALLSLSAVYGKIFCGWACPQNIFYEMFEAIQQPIRKRFPWYRKSQRAQKVLDLSLAIAWGYIIASVAVLYFRGADPIFSTVLWFGLFAFFVYDTHWLKHAFCRTACPYAFIQKGYSTETTMRIGWEDRPGNKCGICTACEKACYVDINPRIDTYHMDCTNCGACIDACQAVFRNSPEPSLLRFAFEDKNPGDPRAPLGINSWGKAFVMLVLLSFFLALGTAIILRPTESFRVDYPASGSTQQLPYVVEGLDANQFVVRIRNLTTEPQSYRLEVKEADYELDGLALINVKPLDTAVHTIQILRDPEYAAYSTAEVLTLQLIDAESGALTREQALLFQHPLDDDQ